MLERDCKREVGGCEGLMVDGADGGVGVGRERLGGFVLDDGGMGGSFLG